MEELSCAEWVILETKFSSSGFSVPVIAENIKQALDDDLLARCRKKTGGETLESDKQIGAEPQQKSMINESCEPTEQVNSSCQTGRDRNGVWKVCHYSLLPHWLQDNDFLLNGHRPPLRSFKLCFNSLFSIHTETVNIWSHLIGAFMFACTGLVFLASQQGMALAEYVVFVAFFLGVFTCFLISTLYHTMHCHSFKVSQVFSRLDYCGIVSIIAGCFTPWVYYLFWCSPLSKLVYMTVAYSLCFLTVNLTMWEKFGQSQFRLLRALVFTGLGMSCSILPGLHFSITHGIYAAFEDLAFGWLFAMSAVAMFGVALYALRIPERFIPGRFDIWCHSHQFFHIAVIIGAYLHLHCLCQMARFRHGHGAACPTDLGVLQSF